MADLIVNFRLGQGAVGYLTSSVQFGFIIGTLLFAILCIADRYSPSRVFFICALSGAVFNACTTWGGNTLGSLLFLRFLTGFSLAGIYPVGMKIAADYYDKGLGRSLGYLVGALVVGTALPHLLRDVKGDLPWETVLLVTSLLAAIGGVLMVSLVPDGPHRRPSQKIDIDAIPKIFKEPRFRAASLGYFGHMWELYTFWAFVPLMLQFYRDTHAEASYSISLMSFLVIGVGGIACVVGGYLAERLGVQKVASWALALSGICCIVSPLIFTLDSEMLFVGFLLFWCMVVIADSPLFSTLVAQHAPPQLKGTALTIVTSIGFFLTIISIQLIDYLLMQSDTMAVFMVLAVGPVLGLWALRGRKC